VVPDTSTFAASLEAYLQRLEHRLKVEIPVGLNDASVAATEARLDFLARDRRVKIDVDSSGFDRLAKAGGGAGRGGGFFALLTNPAVILGAVAAIGGAMAALPGIVASIAAPLGAIALGMDGIKASAKGLKTPFDELKASVSATFERSLTPSMEKLQGIFPTLQSGFNNLAAALGDMFASAVAKLTSPEGLAMLRDIFDSLSRALTILAPAMGPFVDSFLLLARDGAAAFAEFAPKIADMIVQFNEFLNFLDRTGLLKVAMEGLGWAIFSVIGFINGLVGLGILVAAFFGLFVRGIQQAVQWVGQGVGQIIGFLTSLPGRIAGALGGLASAIGGAFTRAFAAAKSAVTAGVNAVVTFIRSLPGKARAALTSLPGLLKGIARNAWNAFFSEVKRIGAQILSWVRSWASQIASAVSGALSIFSPSRVMMDLGKNTMLGFQIGLEKNAQGPIDAMSDAANAVAGIKPTVNASTVQDFIVGSGTDADAIGRAVAKWLVAVHGDKDGNIQLLAAGG
jgi:hypothetical protein